MLQVTSFESQTGRFSLKEFDLNGIEGTRKGERKLLQFFESLAVISFTLRFIYRIIKVSTNDTYAIQYMAKENKNIIDFIEFNLRNGRKVFSMKELTSYKGGNVNAAKQYIKYSTKKGLIKNLSKGFYGIYSPTEKEQGRIPPNDFIDKLMAYKGIKYYTGLLSAAAYYGAAHYRPLVYQVIVDKQVFTSKIILEGINFHKKRFFPDHCIIKQKGNYGYINYSSPALTAYDLIKYENESGTISNIIRVISDMISEIKISDIKRLMKNEIEVSFIQRFGFILEKLGAAELVKPLTECAKKANQFIPLSRNGNIQGNKNDKWKIIENVNWRDLIDS